MVFQKAELQLRPEDWANHLTKVSDDKWCLSSGNPCQPPSTSATVLVLLLLTFSLNAIAIFARARMRKSMRAGH